MLGCRNSLVLGLFMTMTYVCHVIIVASDDPATHKLFGDVKETHRLRKLLEDTLLAKLGLKGTPRPPSTKSEAHVPAYIMHLFEQKQRLRQQVDEPINDETIRSFFSEESADALTSTTNTDRDLSVDTTLLTFNVSNMLSEEVVNAAELRIYRQKLTSSLSDIISSVMYRVDVYVIVKPAKGNTEPITRLIDTRTLRANDSGWETFDVSSAVTQWRRSSKYNYGLEVRVRGNNPVTPSEHHVRVRRLSAPRADDDAWRAQRPFLVIHTRPAPDKTDDSSESPPQYFALRTRTKRAQAPEPLQGTGPGSKKAARRPDGSKKGGKKGARKKNQQQNCRRHPLTVNFDDVGWNSWIVAPPGYDAFYCDGECPNVFDVNMNATNHAIVQSLVHSVSPETVPKPCCVPTELSHISLLYFEEREVVLKSYADMAVEACGCR